MTLKYLIDFQISKLILTKYYYLMAIIKCPKCGSMDVHVTFIENERKNTWSNVGSAAGSYFGNVGSSFGGWLGAGVDQLIGKSYNEYHCYRCQHEWRETVED